eukprot:scaffold3196_cov153-Pinguiococcus_pyrenoidosus.AAC.2
MGERERSHPPFQASPHAAVGEGATLKEASARNEQHLLLPLPFPTTVLSLALLPATDTHPLLPCTGQLRRDGPRRSVLLSLPQDSIPFPPLPRGRPHPRAHPSLS